MSTLKNAVLRVMANGKWHTAAEVIQFFPDANPRSVRDVLCDMRHVGKIESISKGQRLLYRQVDGAIVCRPSIAHRSAIGWFVDTSGAAA